MLRGKSWHKQASSDDALFVLFRVNSPHRVSFEYTCASTPHPIFRLYPRGYRRGGGSRGVGQGEGGLNVDLIGRSSRLGEARRRERVLLLGEWFPARVGYTNLAFIQARLPVVHPPFLPPSAPSAPQPRLYHGPEKWHKNKKTHRIHRIATCPAGVSFTEPPLFYGAPTEWW